MSLVFIYLGDSTTCLRQKQHHITLCLAPGEGRRTLMKMNTGKSAGPEWISGCAPKEWAEQLRQHLSTSLCAKLLCDATTKIQQPSQFLKNPHNNNFK